MKPILSIILLIAMAGCVPKSPSPTTVAAQGIGGVEAHRRSMDGAFVLVEPHADATGKEIVKLGRGSAEAQRVEVERVRKGIDELYVECNKWQSRTIRAEADLKAERSRFFSAIQRHWAWVFAAAWLVSGVLGTFLSLAGYVGVGKFILNLLPFANPFKSFVAGRQTAQNVTVNLSREVVTK